MLKNTVLVMIIAQILGSPVPAQITSMPEREILSYEDSAIRLDTHPDTLMMRCGDHFLYAGQNSEVPILMVDLKPIQTDKGKRLVLFVMLKRNVRVEINNAKSAPTVEVTPGPKFILRINRHDYGKAERCLPRPPGA